MDFCRAKYLHRLPESESYFGDPKSKLPDFKHTIDLVKNPSYLYFTFMLVHQVETCPKRDDYAHLQRQALTIR